MAADRNDNQTPEERPGAFAERLRALAAPQSEARGASRFAGRLALRLLALLGAAALFCAALALGALAVVTRGPSTAARDILVCSLEETSALKFLPYWFLSAAEVEASLHPAPDDYRELRAESASHVAAESAPEGASAEERPAVELADIRGGTWKGKLLTVRDPALVSIATLDAFGGDGMYLTDFALKYSALAATNAGGFEDPNGEGRGGVPDGLVIRGGAIVYGDGGSWYENVVGFDAASTLHIGSMSGWTALQTGLQSAVSFAPGPVLIRDGERQSGWGVSLNPRTCLGQGSDGTVYLAVIEGRRPDSLGASFDDLADLMEELGAVNAINLDGGSSSTMVYEGRQITRGSNLIGARRLATAILVMPAGEGA